LEGWHRQPFPLPFQQIGRFADSETALCAKHVWSVPVEQHPPSAAEEPGAGGRGRAQAWAIDGDSGGVTRSSVRTAAATTLACTVIQPVGMIIAATIMLASDLNTRPLRGAGM
jgi:hypothetical protein